MRNYSRVLIKTACFLSVFFLLSIEKSNAYNLVLEKANVTADFQDTIVEGTVTASDDGSPLPGVNISVKGTKGGTTTDFDGNFIIKVKPTDVLVFTYVGFIKQEVSVAGKTRLNIVLQVDTAELDAVTVVAFGTQKKESVVAAITTVKPSELKIPASNLTASFSGRVPGLISFQTTGEPGADNAEFFIRGVASFGFVTGPLILIDGLESSKDDLARMDVDDIDNFSIMKDASAAALYGSRGANGVILVSTKRGKKGKAKVSFKYETSYSSNVKDIKYADPIRYMELYNDAALPFDGSPVPVQLFSQNIIDRSRDNPRAEAEAPVTDWTQLLFKDFSINHRANLNVSGGGEIAKYFLSTTFTKDTGILKIDDRSDFNTGINLNKFQIRSNNDINITQSLQAGIQIYLAIDDYTGPINGASTLFDQIRRTSPVRYPAFYQPDTANIGIDRIFFGNYEPGARFINPYAESIVGYKESTRTRFTTQINLKQKITEDFKLRVKLGYDLASFISVDRKYEPYYYNIGVYDKFEDTYTLQQLNGGERGGTSPRLSLDFGNRKTTVTPVFYGEFAANYDKTFNDEHTIGATLVATARESKNNTGDDLQATLPRRNLGLAGRLNYSYDTRYFVELNFGYNGSERFSKEERFGFFPSFGAGWTISNEPFWESMSNVVNKFRLRGSYGLVGNDNIGQASERFLYLSNINLNAGSRSATFGEGINTPQRTLNGVTYSRYANPSVTWETAKKFNAALDLALFNSKIDLTVEYFSEVREDIYLTRTEIPDSFGLVTNISANSGEAKNHGFEFSIKGNHQFNDDFWMQAVTNFTYATSERTKFDEPDFSATPWRSKVGLPINQTFGYVAERLFFDEADVRNSPQQFGYAQNVYGLEGAYGPGDIKYKDINRDGVVDEGDQVPIGYPTSPEINYGFGLSVGYKNWDFNCFFNGIARKSFFIQRTKEYKFGNNLTQKAQFSTAPFIQWTADRIPTSENQLLEVYANDHWSLENRDPYALHPRFSHIRNRNNEKVSSWWLRDGSYLRLQQIEVGYTIPRDFVKKAMPVLAEGRIYISGRNLITFSKFDSWDVSLSGNPYKYPVQKVINIGVRLKF
ncbi:TonB-dependent receptor [uncultured Algibacter sp.]|uniref:SusC/RagA family TonB-linked outer membrane protein n=1 Tax=uncultured Algibacter sp. TaxID=298659 RepID=UPI00262B6698|nr:TonB-dependent receptor [uncultured Algibacter sp.]